MKKFIQRIFKENNDSYLKCGRLAYDYDEILIKLEGGENVDD